VKARNRSPHALSLIAREIDVGASMLEDFAAGRGNLSVEVLKALTKVLYDAEFDPESGMLRSANKAEPAMLCVAHPKQRHPKLSPGYRPMPPGPHLPGPQPVVPEKPQPKRGRPGWIGGFW